MGPAAAPTRQEPQEELLLMGPAAAPTSQEPQEELLLMGPAAAPTRQEPQEELLLMGPTAAPTHQEPQEELILMEPAAAPTRRKPQAELILMVPTVTPIRQEPQEELLLMGPAVAPTRRVPQEELLLSSPYCWCILCTARDRSSSSNGAQVGMGRGPPAETLFSFSSVNGKIFASCEKETCSVISSRNPADFLQSQFRGPRHRRGHRDSVTMGESLVLQVSGIPINLVYKMVRDKLLIHFLRRSNGGDGEVDVRYPTEEEGMATLTFGHKEVANRVLSRRHHLKIEGTTYLLEVIRLQCWGSQVSKPLMALSLDEDEGSDSNGRPGYRSDGSSQRRPNTSSTDDSTAIKKHPKSNMAANLHFHPGPTKKIPTDEDRIPVRNSPPASNGKPADSSGLPRHTTFARTQFREDLPESGQLKDTFAADSDSRQWKPKGNIADGFTSNPKLPIGDGSDFNPGQPKNTCTDELNPNLKYSKSAIDDGKKFSSAQPKNTSTEELSLNPKHFKSTIGDSTKFSSGQPKNTSTDEVNRNPKHSKSAIRDSAKFNSGQPKGTSTDELSLNPKHFKSTIGESTTFSSGQSKNTSTDELYTNPNHYKSTFIDSAKFNSGQPKNTSTDELSLTPKHFKSTIGESTKFSSGQPKNTSTEELYTNPNHYKSTFIDSAKFNSGQPKNTSTDELSLNPKHSKSAIRDSAKFNSGQPKGTFTDELGLNPKHSRDAIGDSTKFNSGQPKNTSTDELYTNPNHYKSTFIESAKFNSGQPKNTSTDELSLNPKHFKSTIVGSTKFNSGQPKNTSTDELGSNPKYSRSTIGDSAKFSSGQPKNTSTDELNWNPKLPKNHLGDWKPSNAQNSSPDEFLLNQRTREDLTASSPIRSSLMAARWSSSSSSTACSSTGNHPDQSPLSTDFLVDPAAHTYISVFMKDEINDILGQSGVEMKTETGDGFSRVILTTKSPHLSQNFYKAAHEISDLFMKCQSFLRLESIDLSNISSDVTKKLQLYLLRCGIWSSPNGERLQMIGPYEGIVGFMKKWTSAGGDFARLGQLLQEEASSASSRPPVVGMDNIHQSTAQDHNVTHDVHTQRVRPRDRGEEPGARGGSSGLDTTK
ncbi:uncharacterized protein LOC120941382 [Rana temporaria]|uniref:uncharacterized protein LOC120941382 n=1 Tax=Rana temporaria TaxID=8407 RepID=UPI001AAC55EC|nr:uncharacterized protein LOC120941382 [Rana temporaria]